MQPGAATIESSVELPQKFFKNTPQQSSNSTSGYLLSRIEIRISDILALLCSFQHYLTIAKILREMSIDG